MPAVERSVRINGLSPPYTSAQLSTWAFLPTLVLEFLFFASPLLPLAASIPCTVVFFAFAVASSYFGFLATRTNPADPRLQAAASKPDVECDGEGRPSCPWDPNEPTKQCWICDVQVGEKSMHCKFCNKCVDHFDHHCMWLNTCVGKANYSYFFRTMVSITAMLVTHGAIQLALVLDIFLGNGTSESKSEDWFQADATIAVVAVMCVFILFDLVALSLLGQLLLFHLRLRRDGLTTYGFIVQDNQRKREESKKIRELTQKRVAAVAQAREEGRMCALLHLRVGGYVRKVCGLTCCDPLEFTEKKQDDSKISNGNGASHAHGASNGNGNGEESKEPVEEP